MSAEEFDSLGHDWQRDYRDDGEPLTTMTCALCAYVWRLTETIEQIGPCGEAPESEQT